MIQHGPVAGNTIPNFYLYGEPHRSPGEGFVHVEAIDDRSRPSEWTIRPHGHAELIQLLLVLRGGGVMIVEEERVPFAAPCMLLIPASVVHGFAFEAESQGHVVTAAASFFIELAKTDAALGALYEAPSVVVLPAREAALAERIALELLRELSWAAPGHRAATMAHLLSLFVLALRSSETPRLEREWLSKEARIVARLRERIEQRFRLREPVASHAAALGVSETGLRSACSRIADTSPAAMLDQRALLEAKRQLLYTGLSVAEIAFSLGFDDPAYFSRFFSRHEACSPRSYRDFRGKPSPGQGPRVAEAAR